MRVVWKEGKGAKTVRHEGQSVGAVHDSDTDETYLVVHCTDGFVRRVNIKNIKPD